MRVEPLEYQFLATLKTRQLDAQNKPPMELIAKGGNL